MPRLADIEADDIWTDLLPYISREKRALDLMADLQEQLGPRLSGNN